MVFKKVGIKGKKKIAAGLRQKYRPYEEFPPLDPKDQKLISMLWKYDKFKHQNGIIAQLEKEFGLDLTEEQMLQKMTEVIDLNKVGFITTSETDKGLISYIAAQAIRDYISNDLRAIVIRDAVPNVDFKAPVPQGDLQIKDDYGLPLSKSVPNQWRWPAWGYYEKGGVWQTIYNGRPFERKSDMMITGFNNLAGEPTHIDEIEVCRALVKVIDRRSTGPLDDNKEIKLPTPIMFKSMDRIVINVHTKENAANQFDMIETKALVAEPLGITMIG